MRFRTEVGLAAAGKADPQSGTRYPRGKNLGTWGHVIDDGARADIGPAGVASGPRDCFDWLGWQGRSQLVCERIVMRRTFLITWPKSGTVSWPVS